MQNKAHKPGTEKTKMTNLANSLWDSTAAQQHSTFKQHSAQTPQNKPKFEIGQIQKQQVLQASPEANKNAAT